MAILTHREVAELNEEMIGKGIPDQKDDIGYNKPDYNKMYFIGMLNTERSLEETLISLETLYKYCNTQLAGEKENIEESLEYYTKLFNEKYEKLAKENGYSEDNVYFYDTIEQYKEQAIDIAKSGRNHKKEDYEPRELNYFGIEDNKVKLSFCEFIEGVNLYQFNGRWGCTNEDGASVKGGFTIPVCNINEFLEYAKDLGIIGYKASEKMNNDLEQMKEKPTELAYYGMKNDIAFIGFKEFIKDFAITDYEGKWFKSAKLSSPVMGIPTHSLERFLKDVQQKYNYVAPERLNNDISAIPKENLQSKEKTPCPYKLTATGEVNKYGFDIFHLNTSTPKMVNELWNLKNTAVRYVEQNKDGTLNLSVTPDLLPALCNYLKPKGVDCYDAEHFREIKNKSGNSLKDVSHSDLPFKPYDFQIEDAQKIVGMKRALIGHDMGCGKTLIATMVGESLKDNKKLVVCPESLRLNWQKEIKQFNKNADVNIIYSNSKEVDLNHEWTIMGFATVRKFAPLIINSDINAMFVDEAHNCKAVSNSGKPSSKQAESVLAISDKVDYCYPMTGTPMPTRNKDLFNTFRMLKEYESYKAFFKFGQTFCDAHHNGFGMDYNGSSNEEKLSFLLNEYMVRRVKKDVLPNLQKQRIFIPLENSLMSKEAKANEKHLRYPNEDETFMGLAMTGRNLLSQCKIKSAIDLTKSHLDAEESVVIVSEFNETLDKLQEEFGDTACCIRGGMGDKAKQQAIDDFQSGKKQVCLLNMQAGGVGITLTKAHTMVMCDYDWTPANMTQVEDRICRTGQEHLCNIEYLYFPESILDNTFIEMITDKSELIDKIVDNAENTVNLENAKKDNSTFLDNLKKKIEAEGGTTKTKKTKKKKVDKEEETAEVVPETPEEPSKKENTTEPPVSNSENDENDNMSFDNSDTIYNEENSEQLSLYDYNDEFLID